MRDVILHYHLFKNAGTSVDRMLRSSFGDDWQNFDKASPGAKISALEMQQFIEANPTLKAVSSHQIVPPLPTGNFRLWPVVFLRDPIDRLKSAWLFEWKKQPGLKEPKGSLSDYLELKLTPGAGSVVSNFHVSRLSNSHYDAIRPMNRAHGLEKLDKAKAFVASLAWFGLVERYDESMDIMAAQCGANFPDLVCRSFHENNLQDRSLSRIDRVEAFRADIGEALFERVILHNQLDIQLYEYACGLFDARHGQTLDATRSTAAARHSASNSASNSNSASRVSV